MTVKKGPYSFECV